MVDFKIWIDADACPRLIKEVIYKAAIKGEIPVCLVANSYQHIPAVGGLITLMQVEKGTDMADFYIVNHLDPRDLVITADIPLAALVVEKGATALNPRGELYTFENVHERLSLRDFMKDLRDSGVVTGGPSPIGPKDKEHFANALNRILTKKLK